MGRRSGKRVGSSSNSSSNSSSSSSRHRHHQRRRLERKLLQASATGRLSRVLHLLRKHGEEEEEEERHRSKENSGSDARAEEEDEGHSSRRRTSTRTRTRTRREGGKKQEEKEAVKKWSSTSRIDFNCRDAEGLTPLHHACFSGSEELVQFLLLLSSEEEEKKKVDVGAEDDKGNTPLHIAARLGFSAIISLLRQAGGDMDAPNAQHITPMHLVYEKLRKLQQQKQQQQEEQEQEDEEEKEDFSTSSTFHGHAEWGSRLEKEEWRSNGDGNGDGNWWTDGAWGDADGRRRQWRMDWHAVHMEEDVEAEGLQQLGTKRKKQQQQQAHKDRLEGGLLKERDEKRRRAMEERNREAKRILAEEEAKDRAWRESIQRQKKNKEEEAASADDQRRKNTMYEQYWQRFEQSCDLCLSFGSVPFPVEEGQEGDLAKVIFHRAPASEHKKLLRKEVLRWHPDKFLQKWGARLQGPDHGRILARVNEISQALHQLYSSL